MKEARRLKKEAKKKELEE